MDKPSLNQISSFMEMLEKQPEHFGIFNIQSDKSYDAFAKMTTKQYKYLLYLIFNKHYFKAKSILDELGVEHSQVN